MSSLPFVTAPQPPSPWSGQNGFTSAWQVMQNAWNSAVQQRVSTLTTISAGIRRVG